MSAKEMVYGAERIIDVLDSGQCLGYKYYILNLGTHPTAYVEIPKNHYCYLKQYDSIDIEVHGGLTYSDSYLIIDCGKRDLKNSWFIGWDYAHCDDYMGFYEEFNDDLASSQKKWTTKEIQQDVFSVCEQLKKMENPRC